MPNIGMGQLTLTDLNDAIISVTAPVNPSVGTLWLDTNVTPKLLKRWNGTAWINIGEILDEGTGEIIEDITETLGNMANDNLLDYNERQVIKDKLTDIIGFIIADNTTTLPTTTTLDLGTSGKGSFYFVRKDAEMAGLPTNDARYVAVATEYNNLKSYLESLTPIDAWDLRTATEDTTISVVKGTFRDKWLKYYTAEKNLANATAEKLKENVDDIEVGGTNYASNGDFTIMLDKGLWASSYVGQLKEIVDISSETPPFRYAYHVKNTTATTGGITTPIIFDGVSAEALVDKEITISFWLKYSGITVGAQSYMAGRFGELVIEGKTSGGSSVYSYPRVNITNNTSTETVYVTGTNTTWVKYNATHVLKLPSTAVKLSRISFKHVIENCIGEFWTTGLKIELGNKVTDWSPSPLDIQDRLTKAEFKIQDDQIVSTVRGSSQYQTDVATAESNAKKYTDDTTGNLVNNPAVSGNTTKWSGSGLTVSSQTFQGVATNVLQSSVSADTQNYSDYFNVDPSKAYEVTLWVRKSDAVGKIYLGLNALDGAGSAVGIESVHNGTGVLGNANDTNFYFWSTPTGNNPTSFVKFTTYIMPSGTVDADMKGIGFYGHTTDMTMNARMKPNTKKIRIRFLNWSNGGVVKQVWVANPKVAEVDADSIIKSAKADLSIADMMSDLKVTPVEKSTLKQLWDEIKAEYTELSAQATSLSVSKSAYDTAYTALNTTAPRIETDVLASMTTTYTFGTTTLRDNFKTQIKNYQTEAHKLRRALTDKVQSNLNTTNSNLSGVTTRLTTAESKITDTAIVSTVTASTAWGTKANGSDVWTKDELANMQTAQMLHNTDWSINADKWSLGSGWTRDTSKTLEGAKTMKVVRSGLTSDTWSALFSEYIPATQGDKFVGSVYVYTDDRATDVENRGWALELEYFNGSSKLSSASASIKPSSNGAWERFSAIGTCPANTTQVRLRFHPTRNGTFWVAKPMISKGNILTAWSPHIDELAVDLKSQIDQQAGQISLVVASDNTIKGDALVASINIQPSTIKIQAKNIDINGAVTFSSFDSQTKSALANGNGSIINDNPNFLDWSGTYPAGYSGVTGSGWSKVASGNGMGNAVKYVVGAGGNHYLNPSSITTQPFYQYLVVETTFMLESGTIDGAGILFRYNATTNVDNKFHLKDAIASPTIGKWHTVSKINKYSSATAPAGFTGYAIYPMGGWSSFGTVTAKTIQFDSVKVRPATEAEIEAYEADATLTSKSGTWDTGASNGNSAKSTIDSNKSIWDRATNIRSDGKFETSKLNGMIADSQITSATTWNGARDLLESWKSGTTLINGGKIATNTIFAQQIAIGDYTNMVQIDAENNPNGYTTITNSNLKYFRVGTSSYATITLAEALTQEFKVGDEYYFAGKGYRDSAMTNNITAMIRYYYSDGTFSNAGTATFSLGTSIGNFSVNVKITTDVDPIKTLTKVAFNLEKAGTLTGYYYVRQLEIRKRYGGELIVDGSVVAGSLITSGIIDVGTNATIGGVLKIGKTKNYYDAKVILFGTDLTEVNNPSIQGFVAQGDSRKKLYFDAGEHKFGGSEFIFDGVGDFNFTNIYNSSAKINFLSTITFSKAEGFWMSTTTTDADRIRGKTAIDKVYIGQSDVHFDNASAGLRLKVRDTDYIRWLAGGDMAVMYSDSAKHIFKRDGTKTGGTIVVDGKNYGMSPVDSPQTLIEYIEFDIPLTKEGVKVAIDSLYLKTVENVAIFSNNGKILEKGSDYFVISGEGLADCRIVGERIGMKGAFFEDVDLYDELNSEKGEVQE